MNDHDPLYPSHASVRVETELAEERVRRYAAEARLERVRTAVEALREENNKIYVGSAWGAGYEEACRAVLALLR